MSEVRTRVIYDYGRWDFEQELLNYAGAGSALPTDEEWVVIQAGLQFAINESADAIIRDAIHLYSNKEG